MIYQKKLLANFLNNIASDKRLKFVKEYMIKNLSKILAKGKSKKKETQKKKNT